MTKNEIRARLLSKGFSVRSWARHAGFKEQTVFSVLNLYFRDGKKIKRAEKAKKILRRLGKDVGVDLVGGLQ